MGCLLFLFCFLFFGRAVSSVFSDDANVVEITRKYFYIVGASYGFQGLVTLSTSAFNGINKPLPSTIFSILRMLVLYVPLAWLGAKIFNINGVFWAGFIANVIVGSVSIKYLFKTVKKIESTEQQPG